MLPDPVRAAPPLRARARCSGFLSRLPKDYAHLPEANLRFANVIAQYLLPQRGVLLGLPAFLLIGTLLRGAWERTAPAGQAGGERRPFFLGAALLLGVLPFAHIHTFFVAAGVWAWLAAATCWRSRRVDLAWAGWLGVALALAAPQVLSQFSGMLDPEFSR